MNNKIGIIGQGFIGKVLKKAYPQASVYDKYKDIGHMDEVLNANYIFIAFNVSDNGVKTYKEIAEYPTKAPSNRIFIIKSTFVPGTCDKLQKEFPQHRFIYNPEFLTEMTAWEDFTKPRFQILGVPHESLSLIHDLFSILPEAPIRRVVSPLDAEMLKHAMNSYFALKVTYFNQLYDMCKQLCVDYETVREIMVNHPWIGNSHSQIWHKGYRGFGGKCLPKDTEALYNLTQNTLLETILDINEEYG